MGLGSIYGGGTLNRFIVIEGLDATGKSTLVENLSNAISAVKLSCPPDVYLPSLTVNSARTYFDTLNPLQRRAFYRFSNLVASQEVTMHIAESDVIMDRYWTSTAAFAAMDEGFANDIELGVYPEEILVPDLVILLTVDEENRLKRLAGRGLKATNEELELARNMEKRKLVMERYMQFNPIVLDTSGKSPTEVCQEAIRVIEERL